MRPAFLFVPSPEGAIRIQSNALPSWLGLLTAAFSLATLTGCYTQLAARGYQNHPDSYYSTGRSAEVPADSLATDSTLAASAEGDTLAPDRQDAPAVIVNHYYDPGLNYRGYAQWEWAYPSLSFGYYSSRYDHYSRPYWWDDSRYHRRYGHGRQPARPQVNHPPGSSGPYQSDKRLYSQPPSYAPVRKGRRVAQPASPPPTTAPAQAVPKQGSDGGGSSSSQGGSSSESSGDSKAKTSDSSGDEGYRSLKKGQRR